MRGTILQFVEDACRGEINGQSFLRELDRFLGLIIQASQAPAHSEPVASQENGELRSIVKALVTLLYLMGKGKLPSNLLIIESEYTKSTVGPGEEVDARLLRGIQSLMHILLKTPSKHPLQRWSDVMCAANFSMESSRAASLDVDPLLQAHHLETKHTKSPETNTGSSDSALQNHSSNGNVSIGSLLDEMYGKREDLQEDISMPGYKRALANWSRLLEVLLSKTKQNREFLTRLSEAQLNSVRLLLEWWNDDADSNTSSAVAFDVLGRASQSGLLPYELLSDESLGFLKASKPTQEQYTQQYIRQQTLFGPSGPPYRWILFRLFQVEFLPVYYDSPRRDSPAILLGTRKMAAKIASSQRTAMLCYKSLLATCGLLRPFENDFKETPALLEGKEIQRRSVGGPAEPSTVDVPNQEYEDQPALANTSEEHLLDFKFQRSDFTTSEYEMLKESCHTPKGAKIGASISVCDWLDHDQAERNPPYYLWDAIQKKTVVTTTLTGQFDYTAISHTWGRWKKKDKGSPPLVVEGVTEWRIPQNTKFNVEDLPSILGSIPFSTRFVWFDLVCIPQEPTDPDLIRISKQEIGQQAAIFQGAKYAIAWLNDVTEWKGMLAAVRRLSINFLQEPSGRGHPVPKEVIDLIENDSKLNLEIFDTSQISTNVPESAMDGWFSSLWTLQELCLRPDMLLCNRGWELLTVGRELESAIGIDDLIALSEGGNFPQDTPWETVLDNPSGYSTNYINPQSIATNQLSELLDLSGLEHLLNASRATILMLGNQRQCTKNRAEAIMSAVNVRDWYSENISDSDLQVVSARLEQEKYPLVFLQETARKIGADFYGTTLGEGELLENLLPAINEKGERAGVGSMLPFTSSRLSSGPGFAEGYTAIDHPSVAGWTIQTDLTVKILKAGLLSYTNQIRPSERRIVCTILGPSLNDPPSLLVQEQKGVELDQWVDSFLPTTRNFAVCLHCGHGTGISDGLLLKELSSGELIKIGTYYTTITKISLQINPPAVDVDWIVL